MKTREEVLAEMQEHIRGDSSSEVLEAWLGSLSDEERQIVFDEADARIKEIVDCFQPIISCIVNAFQDFFAGLSPEMREYLASLGREQ